MVITPDTLFHALKTKHPSGADFIKSGVYLSFLRMRWLLFSFVLFCCLSLFGFISSSLNMPETLNKQSPSFILLSPGFAQENSGVFFSKLIE